MKTSISSLNLLLICTLSITNIACADRDQIGEKTTINYTKLCQIFDETMKKPIPIEMQSYEITARISAEVPSLLDLRKNIANADPGDVYKLYKQSAKFAGIKNWECSAIKAFYGPKKSHSAR